MTRIRVLQDKHNYIIWRIFIIQPVIFRSPRRDTHIE